MSKPPASESRPPRSRRRSPSRQYGTKARSPSVPPLPSRSGMVPCLGMSQRTVDDVPLMLVPARGPMLRPLVTRLSICAFIALGCSSDQSAPTQAGLGNVSLPPYTDLAIAWPTTASRAAISQEFGCYHCLSLDHPYHTGIDIRGTNDDSVIAASDGTIALVQKNTQKFDVDGTCKRDTVPKARHGCNDHGEGNSVVVGHRDGLFTQYSHLSAFDESLLQWCTFDATESSSCGHHTISKGQILGKIGGSGFGDSNAWPLHLHFEVKTVGDLNGTTKEWGYSKGPLDSLGWRDPMIYLGQAAGVSLPRITLTNALQTYTGPGQGYPSQWSLPVGTNVWASHGTTIDNACQKGWFRLVPDNKAPYFLKPGSSVVGTISLWACADQLNGGDGGTAAQANGHLEANPNPCTVQAAGGTCTITITWSTSNVTEARVVVFDALANEQELSRAIAGSLTLNWIQALPQQYDFELYQYSSGARGAVLASVHVAVPAPGPSAAAKYRVSATVSPSNAGTVTGDGTVNAGTQVSLKASAAAGYRFDHWGDGNGSLGTANPLMFTPTADRTLTAYFIKTFQIVVTSNPTAGGSVTGGGVVDANSQVILQATASSGYGFRDFSENGTMVSAQNPYAFSADADRSIVANFAAVQRVDIYPAVPSLTTGETIQLTATAYDAAGSQVLNLPVSWASANTQVATVNANGQLTGIAAGTTSISATMSGVTASVQASVVIGSGPVASVTITGSRTVVVGGTRALKATAYDAANRTLPAAAITWTSSNPAIATVSGSGMVSGIAIGSVVITAASGGKSASATVSVKDPLVVESVLISPANASVRLNSTTTFSATAYNASDQVLPGLTAGWSSSDQTRATITQGGVAKGVALGTALITAMINGIPGYATLDIIP